MLRIVRCSQRGGGLWRLLEIFPTVSRLLRFPPANVHHLKLSAERELFPPIFCNLFDYVDTNLGELARFIIPREKISSAL